MEYMWLVLGLLVLIIGGESLVKGAVGLSTAMKISPMVIGLTVVSFGTSAPELLVSIQSAMNGSPGIAIGNVVGSNIANLALVLGVTVLIFPLIAERQTKVFDYPVMLIASVMFYLFALNGVLSLWEGIIFILILLSFTSYLIITSRKKEKKRIEESDVEEENPLPLSRSLMFLLFGLVGLYFGSEWFVSGAKDIAAAYGLSDSVIGVTVVAIGTSAPELVASIVAAMRHQSDMSVGNLVGSNIFNVFAVLGVTSIVTPVDVDQSILNFDMYWMLGISALLIPILYFGSKVGRLKGVILLTSYILYIGITIYNIKN
ncbi:MAG: cation:H+ antiporter [Flavobacteriales bacterium]|jgi:cation:H+ antiporter